MELQIIAHPDMEDFSIKELMDYLEENEELQESGVLLEMRKADGTAVKFVDPVTATILVAAITVAGVVGSAVITVSGTVLIKIIELIYDYIKTRRERKEKEGGKEEPAQENLLITLKDGTVIAIPPGTSKEDMTNLLKAVKDKPESVERVLLVSAGE